MEIDTRGFDRSRGLRVLRAFIDRLLVSVIFNSELQKLLKQASPLAAPLRTALFTRHT